MSWRCTSAPPFETVLRKTRSRRFYCRAPSTVEYRPPTPPSPSPKVCSLIATSTRTRKGTHRSDNPKHRQITYGWEVIMVQTVRPGNAYYPVAPVFNPLSLDNLLGPY